MIRKAIVPIPVTNGTGIVTVLVVSSMVLLNACAFHTICKYDDPDKLSFDFRQMNVYRDDQKNPEAAVEFKRGNVVVIHDKDLKCNTEWGRNQ